MFNFLIIFIISPKCIIIHVYVCKDTQNYTNNITIWDNHSSNQHPISLCCLHSRHLQHTIQSIVQWVLSLQCIFPMNTTNENPIFIIHNSNRYSCLILFIICLIVFADKFYDNKIKKYKLYTSKKITYRHKTLLCYLGLR